MSIIVRTIQDMAVTKMAKSNNLKNILIEEGLFQTQLAHAASVSDKTIGRVIHQTREVSPTTKNRILHGLNKIRRRELPFEFQEIFPNDPLKQ